MNTIFHAANTRGAADHGWLKAHHTFSFANYYDPNRMHFGALRVLNDDEIAAGMGFATHPHDNMEIITIPLEGALAHKDSMGNASVIQKGEIQVMSAGTGIFHSEKNPLQDQATKLLQIWVVPNKRNVTPRYEQIAIDWQKANNDWLQILSPNPEDDGVWIHQNAWFCLTQLDKDQNLHYRLHYPKNGVYLFVISGAATVENQPLSNRDGLGLWDIEAFDIQSHEAQTQILVMEVPMS